MERQDILERRARTGRLRVGGVGQDKSNGAWVRLSRCLHIQDLAILSTTMSPTAAYEELLSLIASMSLGRAAQVVYVSFAEIKRTRRSNDGRKVFQMILQPYLTSTSKRRIARSTASTDL
jgi:hypothetical protein